MRIYLTWRQQIRTSYWPDSAQVKRAAILIGSKQCQLFPTSATMKCLRRSVVSFVNVFTYVVYYVLRSYNDPRFAYFKGKPAELFLSLYLSSSINSISFLVFFFFFTLTGSCSCQWPTGVAPTLQIKA